MKIALEGNSLSLSFSAALQWTLLRLKTVYGQLLHFHSSRNWTNLTEELVGPTTRVAKLIWIANYIPIQYSYLLPVLHVEGFWKLQVRNRGVLFSFTGVNKHLIFGVILRSRQFWEGRSSTSVSSRLLNGFVWIRRRGVMDVTLSRIFVKVNNSCIDNFR